MTNKFKCVKNKVNDHEFAINQVLNWHIQCNLRDLVPSQIVQDSVSKRRRGKSSI